MFVEFYQLEKLIEDDLLEYQKNYIMVRLVTIIEQFFRKVTEFQLRRHPETRPSNITLDTPIIREIIGTAAKRSWWLTPELIISHSLSFQNTKNINSTMSKYGKIHIFSDNSKQFTHNSKKMLIRQDYDKLFDARHDIVHSISSRPHLDIKKYYAMTEKLLNHTLKEVGFWEFHFAHCDALQKMRRNRESKVYFDMADELYNKATTNRNKAIDFLNREKYDEAIKCYNDALDLNPYDFSAHFGKASSLFFLGEYHEAVACLKLELELGDDSAAYFTMGLSLQKLSEHEDAIKCFEKAVEYGSNDATTYISWAVSLGNLGLLDDVLKYINIVLKNDPKNSRALHIKKITQEEINRLRHDP